jgi:hypothetical protein
MKHTKGERWEVVRRDDEMHMSMSVIAPKGLMGSLDSTKLLSKDPNRDKIVAIVFHQCYPFVNNSKSLKFEDKNEIERLIAAAPEMLDLLISALCLVSFLSDRTEAENFWLQEASEIIKRIKGR